MPASRREVRHHHRQRARRRFPTGHTQIPRASTSAIQISFRFWGRRQEGELVTVGAAPRIRCRESSDVSQENLERRQDAIQAPARSFLWIECRLLTRGRKVDSTLPSKACGFSDVCRSTVEPIRSPLAMIRTRSAMLSGPAPVDKERRRKKEE